MAIILLCPTLALAEALQKERNISISVEAEYGANVICGSVYTAAHHVEPYKSKQPAPCCNTDIPQVHGDEIIVISHIDLDTIGGVARALGCNKLMTDLHHFWQLAQHVDLNGPHKAHLWQAQGPLVEEDGESSNFVLQGKQEEQDRQLTLTARKQLSAFHAAAEKRPRLPRDVVTDVTAEIMLAIEGLQKLALGDKELLAAGEAFEANNAKLEAETWLGWQDPGKKEIGYRKSEKFVNHLYYVAKEKHVAKVIVGFNTKTCAITVSLETPIKGVSCREVLQKIWGPEAGGHDGIAGSPRGKVMTEDDAGVAMVAMEQALSQV